MGWDWHQLRDKAKFNPIVVNLCRPLILGLSLLCTIIFCHTSVAAGDFSPRTYPDEAPKTMAPPEEFPNYEFALHNIGNIRSGVSNYGDFVQLYSLASQGQNYAIFEFPKKSYLNYLQYGQLWIGGIIGTDTLVSTGYWVRLVNGHLISEFTPQAGEEGAIIYRSILNTSPYRHQDAVSEQDFVCNYTDTVTNPDLIGIDPEENRPHRPLHIAVRQESYAWSFDYAQDFIMYDYCVRNIGNEPIKKLFIGLFVFPKPVRIDENTPYLVEDHNITGFLPAVDLPPGQCLETDSIRIFWSADEDGRPNEAGRWDSHSLRSVVGLLLLRPGFGEKTINYNWWDGLYRESHYDWGPRLIPTFDDPWRDIGDGLGYPVGDRNRYYLLSHPEFDYDQMLTFLDHSSEGFLSPPTNIAADVADGANNEYLVSFGPYDLMPGDSVPFSFALVAGENFHVNPSDYANYFTPYDPQIYYNKLDFSDLAKNARWARMVYDNPGVDTDGDGYAGEFCWQYIWRPNPENPAESIAVDSFKNYYTGDSIPDFKAMTPPPPPIVRTIPEFGKVTIRWNGQESETTPDIFSGQVDFEGYRVYMSRDDRPTDFVLLTSYDIDDFVVFAYDATAQMWRKITNSAKTDSLKALYGDQFDANDYYDEHHYFVDPHTRQIMYFKKQDWNRSDLSNSLGIHKVYPDASPVDSTDNTLEGYRRCYEYEYTIDNLQPSVPYYFAVTAFDYGAYQYDIGQLETSPTTNAVREFALPSTDTVEHKALNVIVYPNPYRIDAGYARDGYENRDRTKSAAWARRIHFANLPEVCTIRIFTLAGDLVREIKHWCPGGGPACQHEEWNVISRNTQAIVTGIYIWSVRSDMGEQLGKLVIIK